MKQATPQQRSSTNQLTPGQCLGKQAQSDGYDAASELKAGMPKFIRSTAFKIQNAEEVTLQDVEVLINRTAQEGQNESSDQSDSLAPTELVSHKPQQSQGYFDLILNFIHKIEWRQIAVIVLLAICILFNPSGSSTYNLGDYTIYETVYPKHMFQAIPEQQGSGQYQGDLMKILHNLADQDRLFIYLPNFTQKMKENDKSQFSYTKCIETNRKICTDYRLQHYGSMNLQLQNWVLNHLTGHQRIAFEANTNFIIPILLTAMKVKHLALSSKIKKILIIESYRGQMHTNAIKLSLIQNQCEDVVEFFSEHQSYHAMMNSFQYIFASSVFYMSNIHIFSQQVDLKSSLTFIIYVPYNVDSFLMILKQQTSRRQLYTIKFHIDGGKYYAQQRINTTSESAIGSKGVMIILIRHIPLAPNASQITATRF